MPNRMTWYMCWEFPYCNLLTERHPQTFDGQEYVHELTQPLWDCAMNAVNHAVAYWVYKTHYCQQMFLVHSHGLLECE